MQNPKAPRKDFQKLLDSASSPVLLFTCRLCQFGSAPLAPTELCACVLPMLKCIWASVHPLCTQPCKAPEACTQQCSRCAGCRGRRFVLSYFLSDDTLAIFEPPLKNSGFLGGRYHMQSLASTAPCMVLARWL